jgi:hypothetical protein
MNFSSSAYADTIYACTDWLMDEGADNPSNQRVYFFVEDTYYGRSNADFIS